MSVTHIATQPLPIPSVDGERRTDASSPEQVDFGSALVDAVEHAADAERNMETMTKRFADGDAEVGIHEVMIAAGKASVAIRYAVTLKNRAIEAYREIMRTQV